MLDPTAITYANEFVQPTDAQIAHWRVLRPHGARLPTLLGNCPTCSHECEVDITDIVVQGGAPAEADETEVQSLTRQIICNCRVDHQRPPGVRGGCGRYWLATLRLHEGGSYHLTVQKNIQLLPAAALLNEMLAVQDKRIQSAAEKWIGAVTAIYGLFSLAGIATAANALSGLSVTSKSFVGSALFVALVSAGLALFAGYTAAYGWPRVVKVRNDAELQEWYTGYQNYAVIAAKRLREAVLLAFTSLAALVLVMLLVWFLPRHVT